jgi:energy-coupling factor transport system permease protein
MAMPVLEGALDRSLELASSMDARGYGRRTDMPSARRRSSLVTGAGMLLVMVGIYDVLSSSAPWSFGVAALVVGVAALGLGATLSGRRMRRTRYRPDPWRGTEWMVALSGIAVVAAFSVADVVGFAGLQATFVPLAVPPVSVVACVGVLVGVVPALGAPRAPTSSLGREPRAAVDAPAQASS